MKRIIVSLVFAFVLIMGCCGPMPGPEPGPEEEEVELSIFCADFDIITPSYEFYKSMNDIPSFTCDITNDGSNTETVLVTSELVGYSPVFEQTLVLSAGATKTVAIHYSFNDAFYGLQEATSGLLKTKFTVQIDSDFVVWSHSQIYDIYSTI